MTPLQFIHAWHSYCHLPLPRYVADGWLRTASVMIERGVTDADLELVARYMRREIQRSQNNERGSVPWSLASLRYTMVFGHYGSEPEEDLGQKFFGLLTVAEAAKPKPAAKPANVSPMPTASEEQRKATAEALKKWQEGQR